MSSEDEQRAALEARITALEQARFHVTLSKLDGLAYGISLVHDDVRALREQADIHTAALERQERRLDGIKGQLTENLRRLERHGELLEEILRRLPEPGE